MKNKVGAPVDGEDFFGREKEIEYVWELLQDGNNILLPSPRRVGKSSFARKMLEKARESKWETVEMNLEQVHSEFDFIMLFVEKMRNLSRWQKAKGDFGKIIEYLKSVKPKFSYEGMEVSLEWRSEKADVYREVEKVLNHEKETLIFFDEVAVLLSSILKSGEDKKQVEEFLHWLRSLRQKPGSKIRWIFSSSVGIENFTSGHQLGKTINDFRRYELKPFSPESAKAMITALEDGTTDVQLSDEIREKMLDQLGYLLPFFIQILFGEMRRRVRLDDAVANIALVEDSYSTICSGDYLNTWVERLQEQYGDFEADTFLVLKHTCQAKAGVRRESLANMLHQKYEDIERVESSLATILHMLDNDGYLTEENNLYLFRSPLIRDFWHNRFVK